MILSLLAFTHLSLSCAAGDASMTLASVAKTESGFDTLAIHDNTDGKTYQPINEDAARHLANNLIVERGHSVDLGLMQINSANLSRLGMSISDAFDACHSIAAGARILREGYQQALRVSFSRYNTGNDVRGFANGYVRRVEVSASHLPSLDGVQSLPSIVDVKPTDTVTASAAPIVVIDMLHTNQIADEPQGGVRNLLSGVPPKRAAENQSKAASATSHPAV